MIKTQNHRARLIGKETVRRVLWDTTVAGLNPEAANSIERRSALAGSAAGEYYLAADVEEVQAEIVARLREQLVDELCERIAQRMPHLLAVDLLRIRLLYLETLAPLLGH
jgi:hypothetical protein